jgi:hypothetical protein
MKRRVIVALIWAMGVRPAVSPMEPALGSGSTSVLRGLMVVGQLLPASCRRVVLGVGLKTPMNALAGLGFRASDLFRDLGFRISDLSARFMGKNCSPKSLARRLFDRRTRLG